MLTKKQRQKMPSLRRRLVAMRGHTALPPVSSLYPRTRQASSGLTRVTGSRFPNGFAVHALATCVSSRESLANCTRDLKEEAATMLRIIKMQQKPASSHALQRPGDCEWAYLLKCETYFNREPTHRDAAFAELECARDENVRRCF